MLHKINLKKNSTDCNTITYSTNESKKQIAI